MCVQIDIISNDQQNIAMFLVSCCVQLTSGDSGLTLKIAEYNNISIIYIYYPHPSVHCKPDEQHLSRLS